MAVFNTLFLTSAHNINTLYSINTVTGTATKVGGPVSLETLSKEPLESAIDQLQEDIEETLSTLKRKKNVK